MRTKAYFQRCTHNFHLHFYTYFLNSFRLGVIGNNNLLPLLSDLVALLQATPGLNCLLTLRSDSYTICQSFDWLTGLLLSQWESSIITTK